MIEYPNVWQAKALLENDLPRDVVKWIEDTVQEGSERNVHIRPQFIKTRANPKETKHVFMNRNNQLWQHRFEDYSTLTTLDLMSGDWDALEEQHYFVCTNGRRDACCSRLGLPIWRELYERSAGRAWQTTHVGGHRFAPNVLTLPDGLMFGQLEIGDIDDFYERCEARDIPRRFYRGRSQLPEMAQVCEIGLEGDFEKLIGINKTHAIFETSIGREDVPLPEQKNHPVLGSCGDEVIDGSSYVPVKVARA